VARVIEGKVLIAGSAEGPALFTDEPLSLWGGLDARTGEIIDRRHALAGANVAGKIFILPGGRGSSTSSGILLEALRLGTAPAAIITARTDEILALGAIVARELYRKSLPMVVVGEEDFANLRAAKYVRVTETGQISMEAE
jgi:predicted aconitase with swiveling domain